MKLDFILQLIAYTIPALVTAGISYIYFVELLNRQTKKEDFLLNRKPQSDILPTKLQAYERFAILMERIDLKKLVLRIDPISDNKIAYQVLLIQHIEQEYEYNTSQQIYISKELWNIITHVKNNIIIEIQKKATNPMISDANELRKALININLPLSDSTNFVLNAIREEVNSITKSNLY